MLELQNLHKNAQHKNRERITKSCKRTCLARTNIHIEQFSAVPCHLNLHLLSQRIYVLALVPKP